MGDSRGPAFHPQDRGIPGSAAALPVPETLPEALRLAADLADQIMGQYKEIAVLTPKAKALDGIWRGSPCPVITAATIPPTSPEKAFFFSGGGTGPECTKRGARWDGASPACANIIDRIKHPFPARPKPLRNVSLDKGRCPEEFWGSQTISLGG